MELRGPASLETFGNVRHYRYCSAPNLILQPKVTSKVSEAGCFTDLPRELTSSLPCNEIFESFYLFWHIVSFCSERNCLLITHDSLLITSRSISPSSEIFLMMNSAISL